MFGYVCKEAVNAYNMYIPPSIIVYSDGLYLNGKEKKWEEKLEIQMREIKGKVAVFEIKESIFTKEANYEKYTTID